MKILFLLQDTQQRSQDVVAYRRCVGVEDGIFEQLCELTADIIDEVFVFASRLEFDLKESPAREHIDDRVDLRGVEVQELTNLQEQCLQGYMPPPTRLLPFMMAILLVHNLRFLQKYLKDLECSKPMRLGVHTVNQRYKNLIILQELWKILV